MAISPKSFDPRQEMSAAEYELQYKQDSYLKDVELHHHDFYELYYLVSGDVTYTIESKLYHVQPGDVLLISPNELHQVHIRPEMAVYERYVLWISPRQLEQLSSPGTDLLCRLRPDCFGYRNQLRLLPEEQDQIHRLMQSLYAEMQTESYGSDLSQISLLTQLLICINRLAMDTGAAQQELYSSSKTVSQVVAYINNHYSENISLDALAERFFVSKYHLSHEFHRLIGTGVHRYILKKRLLIARHLLLQGKRPSEVWQCCGFGDYSGFFRSFKAEYGTTPKEYAESCK